MDYMAFGKELRKLRLQRHLTQEKLAELVDLEKEKERLLKEEERLTKELARSKGMLNNERFLSRAPEAKVQEEREKLAKYEQMMEQVQAQLRSMN